MPGYKVHVGAGVGVYIALLFGLSFFAIKFSFFKALEWFFCCIIGSLFPDIDVKSKGQVIFYEVITICLLYFFWKQKMAAFAWVSFLAMVPVLARHRGLFHRVWFVIALPFFSALLLSQWYPLSQKMLLFDALFFACGAISHIVFDFWGTKFKLLRF